ncbi:SDR family NAD(P)-dependent oxidoreductase, partial [Fusobacterium sp.]
MNILITGVTKGIGYFLAKEFLKRGDKVFGVGRTFESLKEIEKEYKNFIPLNYDVSNIENIDKIFKEIESENE